MVGWQLGTRACHEFTGKLNPAPFVASSDHHDDGRFRLVAADGHRKDVDIFPPFDIPQIYVIQNFVGMSPPDEGLIVNQFCRSSIRRRRQNVESKSIQQIALIKLSFYPHRRRARWPRSSCWPTAPRRVHACWRAAAAICMDAGSVPVGYLVCPASAPARTLADTPSSDPPSSVQSRHGAPPVWFEHPAIVVTPTRWTFKQLIPTSSALMTGNVIVPAGNLYIKDQMPLVPMNTMIVDPQEIGKIPVKPGRNVYIHDIAKVADSTDVNYGFAMVDGHRSVYIPIVKKNTASTLNVVADIHKAMPLFQDVVPDGVEVRYEFDESPAVIEAIRSVGIEGFIGATLTGLMILIFLHDTQRDRAVFNIPWPAHIFALLVDYQLHINIMTLGLALPSACWSTRPRSQSRTFTCR